MSPLVFFSIVFRSSLLDIPSDFGAQDLIDNRAAYRALCFSTPGLSEHISGVILHWETLMQEDADGKAMVDIIRGNGMIPGIKVDKGYNKKGMWGTPVGPLGHPEVATVGLDDLQQRCAQAYKDINAST